LFRRGTTTALVIVVATGMLLVFGVTFNVNHGGTPGMSRYALWLLAVLTPLVVAGIGRLARREWLAVIAVSLSALMTLVLFLPSYTERANSPNRLATLLWSALPGVDDPLPEGFAERVTGIDGTPPVPAATAGCGKILIRGDGTDAWWPFPCEPRTAPSLCTRLNALCYVNAGAFAVAPSQPRFV